MLQCITQGSASTEGGDEVEDGINLNVTARVSSSFPPRHDRRREGCMTPVF